MFCIITVRKQPDAGYEDAAISSAGSVPAIAPCNVLAVSTASIKDVELNTLLLTEQIAIIKGILGL